MLGGETEFYAAFYNLTGLNISCVHVEDMPDYLRAFAREHYAPEKPTGLPAIIRRICYPETETENV